MSFYSTFQQLMLSMGICVAATALNAVGRRRGPPATDARRFLSRASDGLGDLHLGRTAQRPF